jgi:putative two-component system response regulator
VYEEWRMGMTENSKKILIVDDFKMNIVVLANYLKPPYEIIIALDGAAALKEAEKHKPDMILLDIIMPGMNGFDVFTKLKESKNTMDIPVIFITELDTRELVKRGLSLGALDYITKPFDKIAVKTKIDSYFTVEE